MDQARYQITVEGPLDRSRWQRWFAVQRSERHTEITALEFSQVQRTFEGLKRACACTRR